MRLRAVVLAAWLAACGSNQVADAEDAGEPGDAASAGLDARAGRDAAYPGRDASAGLDAAADGGPVIELTKVKATEGASCGYRLTYWIDNLTSTSLPIQRFSVCRLSDGTTQTFHAPSRIPGDQGVETIDIPPSGPLVDVWSFAGPCCERVDVRVELMATGDHVTVEAVIVR